MAILQVTLLATRRDTAATETKLLMFHSTFPCSNDLYFFYVTILDIYYYTVQVLKPAATAWARPTSLNLKSQGGKSTVQQETVSLPMITIPTSLYCSSQQISWSPQTNLITFP